MVKRVVCQFLVWVMVIVVGLHARLHGQATSPGEVDPTFNPGAVSFAPFGTGGISSVLPQPDGKILVGGAFTSVQGLTRNGLARLNADGSLDTTFVPPFPVANQIPFVRNMLLYPDGRILIAGQGLNVNNVPYAIARLNPDGSLDPTFTLQPMAGGVEGLARLADGRILIGGDFSNIGPTTIRTIARLNADGTLDPTFGVVADGYGGRVISIVVQPDGDILAAGELVVTVGGIDYSLMVRFHPNGALDPTFRPVFNSSAVVRTIALQPDGSMYIGGGFSTIDSIAVGSVARLTAAGAVDTSFVGPVTPQDVRALLLQPDGKLLITGNIFLPPLAPERRAIARLDPSGAFDSFYTGDGLGPGGIGNALALQADGKVIVGGEFFMVAGFDRQKVVRLFNDPANGAPAAIDDVATTSEDNAIAINVVANDTDPDGDTLTVASVTAAAHGSVVPSGAGSVTYTPNANYFGTDTFTYTVDDGHSGTDTATVTVTIVPVNDAPVANSQLVVTNEETPVAMTLTASDVDGGPLAYTVLSSPLYGTLSGVAPNLTYSPGPNAVGPDSFTFRVNDGAMDSNVAIVSIVVNGINDPPAAADDSYATVIDTPIAVAAPGVLANDSDVDGNPLSTVLVTGPANGTLVLNANGSFTFTPATGFVGTATFTYRASDGILTSNVATVSIGVTLPFVMVSGTTSAVPGGTGLFTGFPQAPVVSGSLSAFLGLGAGGQQGVYSCDRTIPTDPCVPIANLSSLIPGGSGTFTGFSNVWTAGGFTSFIGAGPGQLGAYRCDRTIPTDPCVPIATLGSAIPGGTGTFTNIANLAGPRGATSTAPPQAFIGSGVNQAGVYSCEVAGPGDPCTPVANVSTAIPGGTGTFTGFSDVAVALDTTIPASAPIVVFIGSGTGQQGVYQCEVATPGDPCSPVASPSTTIPAGTGAFTGFSSVSVALDTVTLDPRPIVAFIGAGANQMGVYRCVVAIPTDPCTSIANLTTGIPGGTGTFTGFTAVSTSLGHTAFLGQGSAGQSGIYVASTLQKVIAVGDRFMSRTVASLRFGSGGLDGNRVAFGATFTDGFEGVFIVDVTFPANAAPIAIDDAATTNEDVAVAIDVVTNDIDPDGDIVTLSSVTPPAHGTAVVSGPGTVTYTPSANYNGTDTFSYSIGDGHGNSDAGSVTVTIAPVNDAPVAANNSYGTTVNTLLTVAAPGVLANDADVDGNALTAVLVTAPTSGTVVLNANGSFTYTPAPNFTGSATFTYTARDSLATSNAATVTITMTGLPSQMSWRMTASLLSTAGGSTRRSGHTATLLPNGRILVVGGAGTNTDTPRNAQLYNPATGTWSQAGIITARAGHTATLLPNGKVLIVGGLMILGSAFPVGFLDTALLYDPATGSWSATGSLLPTAGGSTGRSGHTATLLPNGKVLVVGGMGTNTDTPRNAQLYNPATGTWSHTANIVGARSGHTATLLTTGKVLVAGGYRLLGAAVPTGFLDTVMLYDPARGTWTATASFFPTAGGSQGRANHTATLLPDGKVLVAGGAGGNTDVPRSAQLYTPATGQWTITGGIASPRSSHTATLLPSGKVLIAGGLKILGSAVPVGFLDSALLYDTSTGAWSTAASLNAARANHTATLLPGGHVLAVAGLSQSGLLSSAEVYGP
jgi:uncharacterized delta-60 repeat protein